MMSTVGEVLGGNVRWLREQKGWTRQELAARLHAIGLRWTHHQITAIELGRRDGIELAELVLLLDVFETTLDKLLCSAEYPGVVTPELQLTPDAAMCCEDVRRMLAARRYYRKRELALSIEAGERWLALRADEELAERLGVGVAVVMGAAERLWGHSLTAERDRRVDELGDAAGDRRALRGHVTRQLATELEDEITNNRKESP